MLAFALISCGKPGDAGPAGDGKTGENSDDEIAAVPVEAAVAKLEPIVASYTGTATLEADRQAEVVARTSGVLLRLHVEEGDIVRAGQTLAQLDAERARLELQRAEANLKRLENDFARSKELYAAKLTTTELNDKVKFELDTQRAAFDLMKLELSYTTIVAPIDGVISERMVKEGNLIQMHTALFRIDDFDPLLAVLNVPERELAILKPGLPVSMAVDALPGRKFEGKVARVSPVVDKGTGTFRVTCEFHDETGALKSGMFGRVDIVYDRREEALVVPREAVVEEDGEASVFVVINEIPKPPAPEKGKEAPKPDPKAKPKPAKKVDVAHVRKVATGYGSGDKVEIREGLKVGDRVITVGRAAVRDGTEVQILESVQ